MTGMRAGAYGRSRIGYCPVTDKIAYGGRSGAEQELFALAAHDARGDSLQTYRCSYCRAWHVGHRVAGARPL